MDRVIKRRSRVPLSCEPCRTRKLKCNRQEPCQNCTARQESEACYFRKSGSTRSPNTEHAPRRSRDQTVRQRIDHLESTIKRLLAEQSGDTTSAGTDIAPSSSMEPVSAPSTMMDGQRSVYLGSGDWSAVLSEINALKETWDDETLNEAQIHHIVSHTVDGSSLLFAQGQPADKFDILSSLPPRHEVDMLVAEFFDRETFPIDVPPLLHQPTFMREYERHWMDPSQTDFMWLGLLFSILNITMLAYLQHGEPAGYQGRSEHLYHLYRVRTAQCLQNGDIAKCLPYTVETLRFNTTAELNREEDTRRGLWITTGVLVRAAINMGYHRDPAQMPGVTVLQAEYRRRVWAAVVSTDNMIAFRGGFPPTMPTIYSDTQEPGKFDEADLSEDMETLPVSRPLTENTPCTYLILKLRLTIALNRVTDGMYNLKGMTYDAVVDIDRALHEVYEDFPPYMRPPEAGRSLSRPPHLTLARFFHRGVCTLHRKFMAMAAKDNRYQLSRSRCISSASCLLVLQQDLKPDIYREPETRQVLMMCGMMLLQELAMRRKIGDGDALLATLEKSCAHLAESMCVEAMKLHEFLVKMLSRLRNEEATSLPNFDYPPSTFEFAFERDWADMEIDWATLNACITDPQQPDI